MPLFFLACLALATAGCEQLRTVKQCRALSDSVNPKLEAIGASPGEPATAAGYQKAAVGYANLAQEVDQFDAGVPELDRAVDDYASALRTSSVHAGELAKALDAGNLESAALAGRELEQLKHAQKSAVKRFQQECQGH